MVVVRDGEPPSGGQAGSMSRRGDGDQVPKQVAHHPALGPICGASKLSAYDSAELP